MHWKIPVIGTRPLLIMGIAGVIVLGAISLLPKPEQDVLQLAGAEEFVPSKYDERLLVLEKEAVDNAFRDKIEQLIAVWHRDETDQPARAINGAKIARKRYINMMDALEKRERELQTLRGLQR